VEGSFGLKETDMVISRRMLIVGTGVVAGAFTAPRTEACTLIARKRPISFSDRSCRQSLGALVALINRLPVLSVADLKTKADAYVEFEDTLSIQFDEQVIENILGDQKHYPVENSDLINGWSLASGKRDKSPMTIDQINLLKSEKGLALYQFTLKRNQYHSEITEEEAASDSCGSGPVAAFYGYEKSSYLGVFVNNKLREVSTFDAWLRGPY
jgi:hypothetical protein